MRISLFTDWTSVKNEDSDVSIGKETVKGRVKAKEICTLLNELFLGFFCNELAKQLKKIKPTNKYRPFTKQVSG